MPSHHRDAKSTGLRLEDLQNGLRINGIDTAGPARIIEVQPVSDPDGEGIAAVRVFYEDIQGHVDRKLLRRADEAKLERVEDGWAFDADPQSFLLAAEALRIQRAHLFDPYQAARASNIEPLPHQVVAVYQDMLPRQPLRFLLADDPGSGKTIMAGLLIKELILRGDLNRCLVVAPGGLVYQWQSEMSTKFGLEFNIFGREMVNSSMSVDPLAGSPLLIAKLDMLSRGEDLHDLFAGVEWDLVVVDEAHKMAAHASGQEVKKTKRYQLGEKLRPAARNLLLMTATPHNGYSADFELFLSLLDVDRFEGRYYRHANRNDKTEDLMRRMIKEEMKRLDGTLLFPDRRAESVSYTLSKQEMQLYEEVTTYVREGMHRVERLEAEVDGRRYNAVGFALMLLQRRLASSTYAVLRSLQGRRERLTNRLQELRNPAPSLDDDLRAQLSEYGLHKMDDLDEFMEYEEEELDSSAREQLESAQFLDEASFAQTVEELEAEIKDLTRLEKLAKKVLESGTDRKWDELAHMLQNTPEMRDEQGRRKKLIVFTEHRATLEYLMDKLRGLLGNDDAVVQIHGNVSMEDRREVQEQFTHDPEVIVLAATDAAGEGINLQCAHLMVNYDVPWNPNRIEQRFGRIHRIGQTEVCRLWNLVASNTREGAVFERLFDKLEEQRRALGGKVFDVLGEAFADTPLRQLLIKAITEENPKLEENRLLAPIDAAVGDRTREILNRQSLLHESLMSSENCDELRDELDRAACYRLQPSYVRRFFLEAFEVLEGRAIPREQQRFQVNRVPLSVRSWDEKDGSRRLLRGYERICFDRSDVTVADKPRAALLAPGHPLLDAVVGRVLEKFNRQMQQGAVLVDPEDMGTEPRLLVFLEHEIRNEIRDTTSGQRQVVSRRFEYVEVTRGGKVTDAGRHPYLDYRVPDGQERELLAELARDGWLSSAVVEKAKEHAVVHNVERHLEEIRPRVQQQLDRTREAVEQRLTSVINDERQQLQMYQSQADQGSTSDARRASQARRRAQEAEERLQWRLEELQNQRELTADDPRELGVALVVPAGLVAQLKGEDKDIPEQVQDRQRVERLAIEAVLELERSLGRMPKEMPRNNKGYDIETRKDNEPLLFIEVKGRAKGAKHFGITASEVLCGLNNAEQHILALVEVAEDDTTRVRYLRDPFTERQSEPGFGEHRRELKWRDHWRLGETPVAE